MLPEGGRTDEAVAKKIERVEIIPGQGSGQLKKRVLRFLDQETVRLAPIRLCPVVGSGWIRQAVPV